MALSAGFTHTTRNRDYGRVVFFTILVVCLVKIFSSFYGQTFLLPCYFP